MHYPEANEARSSKLDQMKLQAPSTKRQRSSKSHAARVDYSRDEMVSARVREEASNWNGAGRHPFDLQERTAVFGEAIVGFAKKIPRSPANERLIGQLVGCGTSIGANYCEANERVSK